MAGLREVRQALAATIEGNIFPALPCIGNPGDTVNVPIGLVLPSRGTFATYGQTLGSDNLGFGDVLGFPGAQPPVLTATGFRLDLQVLVQRNDADRMQDTLDQWFGYENYPGVTVSAAMAVAKDHTLGGVVRWCNPLTADAYQPIEYNGVMYFGARIHFDIGLV